MDQANRRPARRAGRPGGRGLEGGHVGRERGRNRPYREPRRQRLAINGQLRGGAAISDRFEHVRHVGGALGHVMDVVEGNRVGDAVDGTDTSKDRTMVMRPKR